MGFLTREDKNELVTKIAELRGDIKGLKAERDATREELRLADEVVDLKRKVEDLKIGEDRIKERHARERREVEHDVGLLRKRQEFELEAAKRETQLDVREENLTAERERFERDMNFRTEQLDQQIGYLKELMGKLFERLPSISTTLRGALVSAASNGDHED